MNQTTTAGWKPGESGRTLAEHIDIARSIESDPKGSRVVHLDFESGDFSGWSVRRLAQPYSAAIQGEVVRVGTKACRFEIRPGDRISQGRRAELRDWYNAPFEQDTWYGFSTLLPADFAPPPGALIVLAQWHDQAQLGEPSGKPPFAVRFIDGALLFTGAFAEVADPEPETRYLFHKIADIPRGRWMDFVFRIHWSKAGDSTIEAWLDGKPLFSFTGLLGYRNQIQGPYFKFGVYSGRDIDRPLVVYHDNYSRADSYDAVDPSAPHTMAGG